VALVSGGGRVSQWSAVVTVWLFRVDQGGHRRFAAVEGGSFFFVLVSQVGVNGKYGGGKLMLILGLDLCSLCQMKNFIHCCNCCL